MKLKKIPKRCHICVLDKKQVTDSRYVFAVGVILSSKAGSAEPMP